MNQRTPKQPQLGTHRGKLRLDTLKPFCLQQPSIILVSSMLTKTAVLSPMDRADLAHCRHAAGSQPAQTTGLKNTQKSKKVQILGPVLGSIFGPQNGPQVGCLIKNPIEARFRGPFLVPFLGPKIGTKNRSKNAEKKTAKNSKKTNRKGSRDSEKNDLRKPAKAPWNPLNLTPLLITYKDLLQPALVACM